jgi:hypothetical protein
LRKTKRTQEEHEEDEEQEQVMPQIDKDRGKLFDGQVTD